MVEALRAPPKIPRLSWGLALKLVEPLGQASAHPTEAMMSIQSLHQTAAADRLIEVKMLTGRRGRRACGSAKKGASQMPEIVASTFVLAVNDLEASKRFYLDKLGFAEDFSVDCWAILRRGWLCKLVRRGHSPMRHRCRRHRITLGSPTFTSGTRLDFTKSASRMM